MCICNRNWQANDCSERICQFGLAHVDTPKGDLDMSGALNGPDDPVIDNSFVYPYGTTEQFPQMEDSDLNALVNSGHYYMECSNKGVCDRASGGCSCYPGYDGVACQRASCPGYPASCSGHGVCKSIKQLAASDNSNVYKLWDRDATMGCACDRGFSGPDCSIQSCKVGVDPLYIDDSATVKFSIFDFATLATQTAATAAAGKIFSDGQYQNQQGYWAIKFFDAYGEDWVTRPIVAGAPCTDVINALESLPNNVVPPGKLRCSRADHTAGQKQYSVAPFDYDAQNPFGSAHPYKISYDLGIWESHTNPTSGELSKDTYNTNQFTSAYNNDTMVLYGYIYRMKFYGNPGKLMEPTIEIYLDGVRPSLVSSTAQAGGTAGKVITKVWTDGQQGENDDMFANHCDGVSVSIGKTSDNKHYFLTGLTHPERALLKTCLGQSDFDTSNNHEVYNWDYGSQLYPHLIKLVRTVTTFVDGGYYAAVWYDTSVTSYDSLATDAVAATTASGVQGTFKLVNPFFPPDAFASDSYEVYTTTGTFALTSNASQVLFDFGSKYAFTVNGTYDVKNTPYDGDISCEIGNNNAYKFEWIFHCVNKTDIITYLNWNEPWKNPPHINLYTATRLQHTSLKYDPVALFGSNPYTGGVRVQGTGNAIEGDNVQVSGAHYMTHMITTDLSSNWGKAPSQAIVGDTPFFVYKFFPADASTYTYVAPCANRGICDETSGTCKCFPGYTNDNCDTQSSLAL